MNDAPSGCEYALHKLSRGGYEIEWRGRIVGKLVQDGQPHWTATLAASDARVVIPPPFVRFEHVFGRLVDALDWLGNPEIKRRV
jgi:hypothetical protein